MIEEESQEPENRENTGRNENGTFKPGVSGNPGGRPKSTMKDYLRRKFSELSDEDKESFLKENKVSGVDQIKLAEGNPHQSSEVDVKGNLQIQFASDFKKDD